MTRADYCFLSKSKRVCNDRTEFWYPSAAPFWDSILPTYDQLDTDSYKTSLRVFNLQTLALPTYDQLDTDSYRIWGSVNFFFLEGLLIWRASFLMNYYFKRKAYYEEKVLVQRSLVWSWKAAADTVMDTRLRLDNEFWF